MKKITLFSVLFSAISCSDYSIAAENPILEFIQSKGIAAEEIDDVKLDFVRGAGIVVIPPSFPKVQTLYGQALPSVSQGMKTHMVTYKSWGSTADYTSYNYIGFSYDPNAAKTYSYNGQVFAVTGDEWLADRLSAPTAWNLKNSSKIDYHYQVLDRFTGALTASAFRYSLWNRPLTTFKW